MPLPDGGPDILDVELDAEELALLAESEPGSSETIPTPVADPSPNAAAAPTPDSPTTDAPAQADSAPLSAAAATTPTSAPEWGFSADGIKVTVPGAKLTPDGILIPKAAWDRTVQPHLADRKQWNVQVQEFRRTEAGLREQVQQIELGQHPAIVRANAVTARFDELLNAGPEKIAEFLDNFAVNRPILEAEARAKAAEMERDQFRTRQDTANREAQQAALEPQKRAAVEQQVSAMLATPDLKDLGIDGQRLMARLVKHPGTYVTADRDYPEIGLRKGELAINLELVREEVQDAADQRKTWLAQQQATAQNAKAQAGAPVPPATPVRGSPAPGGKQPDKPTSWSEFQDRLMEI